MANRLKEGLNSLYAAFKIAKVDFLLNAFDENIEFVSYSPVEVFPFLGHHREKAAMAAALKAGYAEFEFVTYEPAFIRRRALSMSALGQKQTYAPQQAMSALPLIATAKADMRQ